MQFPKCCTKVDINKDWDVQILAGETYSHRNLWITKAVKAMKPLIAEGEGSVNLNKKQGQRRA